MMRDNKTVLLSLSRSTLQAATVNREVQWNSEGVKLSFTAESASLSTGQHCNLIMEHNWTMKARWGDCIAAALMSTLLAGF
jgi:hypothetical protein